VDGGGASEASAVAGGGGLHGILGLSVNKFDDGIIVNKLVVVNRFVVYGAGVV